MYRLVWLEIARRQYGELAPGTRQRVDQLLRDLQQGSAESLPGATHDERSDQWIVPVNNHGLLMFAVVRARMTVIILRLIIAT